MNLFDEFLNHPGLTLLDAAVLSLAYHEQVLMTDRTTAGKLGVERNELSASVRKLIKRNLVKPAGAGGAAVALTGLALNLLGEKLTATK